MKHRFEVEMGRIVTFGEIMLRLAPEGFYRLFQNDRLQASFGGAEANVAVSLSNFGDDAVFISKVPEGPVGQAAIDSLRRRGVDTGKICRGGNRLGIYYLEKGANQRGSLCIYDRKGSSISEASAEDFDWESIFQGADWFHFTGITPALSDTLADICEDACKTAHKYGVTVSCDLNYRSKLWDRDTAEKVMSKLCSYVDVCIANEEDAKNIFGIEASATDVVSGVINKQGYESIAAQLKSRFGFRYVAFTFRVSHSASHNDWSGMLYDGKESFYSPEYQITNIVDRVGGGDSFGAGLIHGLVNGHSEQYAINFAVAASALKHSIEGDYNLVSADEVIKLAEGDKSGRVQR